MPFLVSGMPSDDTHQEEIERRRAERIARKEAKDGAKTSKSRWRIVEAKHREKDFFPNLTGEYHRAPKSHPKSRSSSDLGPE